MAAGHDCSGHQQAVPEDGSRVTLEEFKALLTGARGAKKIPVVSVRKHVELETIFQREENLLEAADAALGFLIGTRMPGVDNPNLDIITRRLRAAIDAAKGETQ
jgi:hypothetical protein